MKIVKEGPSIKKTKDFCNLILDGNSLLYRCHWVNKVRNNDSPEFDSYLFLKSFKSYLRMFEPDDIYIAWDKKLKWPSTNFRDKFTKGDYKGQRDKSSTKDIYACVDMLCNMTKALGCKNMFPRIMEADDVIGWLIEKLKDYIVIVTVDRDMLQLVNENVDVYLPMKKILITLDNFEEEIGVAPEFFLVYKAAMGDKSDNIPGIPKCGKVTAKKVAAQYYCNDGFPDDKLKILTRNLILMDLKRGYKKAGVEEEKSYKEQFKELKKIEPNMKKFVKYCKEYEYNSFLDIMNEWEELCHEK